MGLAASPAEDLYDQSTRTLQDNYFGYSAQDLPALVETHHQQLQAVCKPRADSCPVELGRDALEHLLAELNDPHTYYLYPEESVERDRAQAGQGPLTPRIGLTTAPVPGGGGRVVLFVRDDGPAFRAGMKPGDLITGVAGKSLSAREDGGSLIAEYSQKHLPFELTIKRGTDILHFTLQAEVLTQAPLPTLTTGAGLPNDVGLLQIPDFEAYQEVGFKVHNLVKEAQSKNLKALIVDLRNNEGGLLVELLSAVAAFAPNPALLSMGKTETTRLEYRRGSLQVRINNQFAGQYYAMTFPQMWTGKLAVLVNKDTASSGEYFAYYLQKLGVTVIGEPTAGLLNTASQTFDLPDRGALVITTVKSASPDGTFYPERLTPDIMISDDLLARAGNLVDPLVQRALEELDLTL
ncbi:protease [Deinococcus roseus]|uniref:Protease n=2 Tax=Deinococcus roseus TaxID=392414 RepID=A0ABQ2DB99_9DEIO|nr:protease [Deinococcus roseus]